MSVFYILITNIIFIRQEFLMCLRHNFHVINILLLFKKLCYVIFNDGS